MKSAVDSLQDNIVSSLFFIFLKSALLFGPTAVGPAGVENICLLIVSINSANKSIKVCPLAIGSFVSSVLRNILPSSPCPN